MTMDHDWAPLPFVAAFFPPRGRTFLAWPMEDVGEGGGGWLM